MAFASNLPQLILSLGTHRDFQTVCTAPSKHVKTWLVHMHFCKNHKNQRLLIISALTSKLINYIGKHVLDVHRSHSLHPQYNNNNNNNNNIIIIIIIIIIYNSNRSINSKAALWRNFLRAGLGQAVSNIKFDVKTILFKKKQTSLYS